MQGRSAWVTSTSRHLATATCSGSEPRYKWFFRMRSRLSTHDFLRRRSSRNQPSAESPTSASVLGTVVTGASPYLDIPLEHHPPGAHVCALLARLRYRPPPPLPQRRLQRDYLLRAARQHFPSPPVPLATNPANPQIDVQMRRQQRYGSYSEFLAGSPLRCLWTLFAYGRHSLLKPSFSELSVSSSTFSEFSSPEPVCSAPSSSLTQRLRVLTSYACFYSSSCWRAWGAVYHQRCLRCEPPLLLDRNQVSHLGCGCHVSLHSLL
jgi:hypothetical protein